MVPCLFGKPASLYWSSLQHTWYRLMGLQYGYHFYPGLVNSNKLTDGSEWSDTSITVTCLMGQVTKLWLSCYLVLLSIDSKTRQQDSRSFVTWPICILILGWYNTSIMLSVAWWAGIEADIEVIDIMIIKIRYWCITVIYHAIFNINGHKWHKPALGLLTVEWIFD